MARQLHKFTAKAVEALRAPGRHSDGGGLYLKVLPNGRRQWVFMFRWLGKQKEMGLGAFVPINAEKGKRYEHVSLAEARTKAAAARASLTKGENPLVTRHPPSAVPTFGEFADLLIDDLAVGFRNQKHLAQWRSTLGEGYCSELRNRPVDAVTTDDVLTTLKPIWQTKNETASRIRGRIERVLDAAKARGHRDGENPARWRGHLDTLLPRRQKLQRGHHAAMPYSEVPTFLVALSDKNAMAARALEFLILTAARTGEVLGATWEEFDLDAGIWTVPPKRMKAGREHRVPLPDRALGIVKALNEMRVSDWVFPSDRPAAPMSNMALTMLMRRMKAGHYTVHGFRSAFRDWAAEETSHSREIAEAALAHVVGDATERAYRRGDALAKRRELMEHWQGYLDE